MQRKILIACLFVSLLLLAGCTESLSGLLPQKSGNGPASVYPDSQGRDYRGTAYPGVAPAPNYEKGAVTAYPSSESTYNYGVSQSGVDTTGSLKTKEATLTIKVEKGKLEAKLRQAKDIVASRQGEVNSVSYDESDFQKTYYVEFKILPARFDDTVEALKALGEIKSANVNIEDVTERHRDLSIRLENKKTELQRLYVLYNQSESVEELLSVESEITRVETEIEQLQGEKQGIEKRVEKSTIVLGIYEETTAKEGRGGNIEIHVKENELNGKLQQLKAMTGEEKGEINSLNFVESSDAKTYDIIVRLDSGRLEEFMEKTRSLGDVKRMDRTIDEKNMPEKSLVYMRLVEEKPALQTNLVMPLENLISTFLGALSMGMLIVFSLIGFLLPGAVLLFIVYKIYLRFRKKGTPTLGGKAQGVK